MAGHSKEGTRPKEETRRDLRVILASPRGFCAGVERAIEIVERALEKYGPPVYVRHEIVHNKRVVETLRAKGAVFVEEIDEVPVGAVTIFSAHGVARKVEEHSAERELHVIDATCPLVSKVHKQGQRYSEKGYEVVLIGHHGHPEVEGTMGQVPGTVHLVGGVEEANEFSPTDPKKISYVTQTTLSVDDTRDIITALENKYPEIVGPDVRDICYATQNRQSAVRQLVEKSDVLLVVGASNSSNSNRLREIGEAAGVPSYLVADSMDLDPSWLVDAKSVGITAGASAPEELVSELVERMGTMFNVKVQSLPGVEESMQFRLPRELLDQSADAGVAAE